MSDYRIAKLRHSVEVTLANGRRLDGDVFVQHAARFRNGPEEPLDLLNSDDPFVPLAAHDGEVRLIQKAHIAMVGMPLPLGEEPEGTGVVGMRVELTLIDGSSHFGSIFPELRDDRPRLVDFLNDMPFRFLALFTSEQLCLVNRMHIAYVRPVI